MKKQLSKCAQVQQDCDKKEKENRKKAADFQNEFDKACKQLGITGVNIRKGRVADAKEYIRHVGKCSMALTLYLIHVLMSILIR